MAPIDHTALNKRMVEIDAELGSIQRTLLANKMIPLARTQLVERQEDLLDEKINIQVLLDTFPIGKEA